MRRPAGCSRPDVFDHPLIFATGHLRFHEVIPIRLVDYDRICQFHDSLLDALQFISGTSQHH